MKYFLTFSNLLPISKIWKISHKNLEFLLFEREDLTLGFQAYIASVCWAKTVQYPSRWDTCSPVFHRPHYCIYHHTHTNVFLNVKYVLYEHLYQIQETEIDLEHLCMSRNAFLHLFYFAYVHYLHGCCRHLSLRAWIQLIYYRRMRMIVSRQWSICSTNMIAYESVIFSVDGHVDIDIKNVWEDQAHESICSDH